MSFEQLKQDLEDIAGGRWHSSAIETQAEEQQETALSVQDIGQVPSFHDASQAVREQPGILPGMDGYGQCYVDRGSRGLSPIEKVLPLNAPFKMNMQTMGQIFNGDPLAFIADPKQRQYAESLVEISRDPERTRRRLALAAYFTMVRPVRNEDGGMMNMSMAYAYRNAESLAAIFTNGKGGIEQAYDSIRNTLEWNPENPAPSMPKSLKFRIAMEEGTSRLGNTIYNLASIPFYMAGAREMGDYVQKYKHELYDQYAEAQREYGVPADWMTNSDSFVDWVFNAATATAAYMPSLSAQVALGGVTGGLAPFSLGAMFAIDDYFDTRHEHPEASRGQALLHAGLIGVINGLSEHVLMGVASGSISRHYVKNGLKPGLARAAAYLGIDTFTNAAQEGLEQIAENASDLLCGTGDRKWSGMSGRERYDYIMRGVPEAAFLGGVTGLGMSAGNYKGMRDYYNRVNQGYAAIARTRAELEAKTAKGEGLTEAEAARLRYCQRAMDSVDADACANAAIANQQWELKKALQEEAARRNAERDAQKARDIDAESRAAEDSELSAYFTEQLSDNEDAGDVSQDTWDAAEQALRNLKIKATEGTHKVNDTIRAVYEFLKNVPGVKCQVLTDAKSIPQHVKDQLKADGLAEDQMRGCVGRDNVVYIRADLVRPSEVEQVLTHEVVGHIGLENYFGHRFVPFLDEVYDQHFQRMDAIRELYRLGGRADTPETRRAITREWLAEMAAKMPDQRPRAWTDIANRLRLFMHRIGFKSHWSDRDLAALFVADRRHLVAASPDLIRENVRQANEALGIDGSATGGGESVRSDVSPSLEEAPWPKDFPKVTVHTTIPKLRNHPDYAAAKAGDRRSAARVVADLVKTERIIQLGKAHPNAIVVPVHAEEASGRNAIPEAYAERIGRITGLEVDSGIVQSARAYHTDKGARHRLISQAEFDGPVKAVRDYIIVDDVITMGGTINALRNHIIRNGGKVAGVTTLTFSRGGNILSLQPGTLAQLRARFGSQLDTLLYEAGIATSADALTEAEGRYLSKLLPDTLRDFCLEAGQERSARRISEDNGRDGGHAPSGLPGQIVPDSAPPRSGATPSLRPRYSSDDINDYIAVLKTAVGTRRQKADSVEKWMQWCRDHYIKVDAADVMEFVEQARAENRVAARREHQDKVEEYICQTEDIFNALQQLGYSPYEVYQRKIVPTAETSGGGEVFTGTFIHPAFQSKSKAASMDYDASDDRMRKTARRIKERQHDAATAIDAGMAKAPLVADDVARMINDKLGTSYTDEDIQNYFIGKTWEGLEEKYRHHLQDAEDEARYWEEVGKEQLLNEKKARIEDEAISFLENPREVTMEYAEGNPEVVQKLWQMLLPGENYGQKLEEDGVALDADSLNMLNSALQLGQFDTAAVAESIRRMRQEEHATYMQKLHDLDANIRQKELDVARLQRDAVAFARKALPEDARWSFMDAIMKLPGYGTTPTVRHPEGRRMAEFHKILDQVLQKQSEVRRAADIADINRMLDSARQGRNWRGIPVSIIPGEQGSVDLIRQVMKWDPAAVAAAIEDRMTTLQTLDEAGTAEDDGKRGRIEKELALIAKFGNLEYRDAKDAAEAAKELKNIIGGAKATFREQLTDRAKWLDQRRADLIRKLTGGRPLTDMDTRAGFLKRFLDSNDTLETTLAMLYGDPTDFDATEGGKLFQRIVDATYAASGQRLRLDLAFREALASCAGARTASQRARFIQQLRDVHEHTGALKRHYTRVNEDSQGNTLEFSDRHGAVRRRVRIEDSDGRTGARSIVRMADQGKPLDQISRQLNEEIGGKSYISLTPASIEWLRQQIADRDAGVQNIRDVYGDDLDNDALARMESDSADAAVEIISDSPKTTYEMQEVTGISKAQALQIILTWEQEQYRHGMEWNGWTQDSIDALKKFAGKEALALGYWMRGQIAKNRDALDSAVYKRFGAHLPDNPNYWPGKFQNDRSGVIRAQGSNGISSLSITPAFLTARRFHLQPVALDIDAVDVFFNNQNQQIQMLAFGDVMRDAQGIFGNANVQKAIRNRFGEHAARNVMKLLGNIANNGAIGDDISKFISVFYRSYVPAKIAFNPASLAKQVLGAASYALDVPMKDMAVAMADVASWSPEYRHFRKLARNSDYYKARTQQGANPELQIINGDQAFRHGAIMQGVTSAASFLTVKSDATAALTVGYASFKYARDNAIKQGLDAKAADAAALMAWQRATDETQQSGYLKDANQYMAARGLSRAFTMFMSNAIQTMQVEKRAYRAWRNAQGDAKAGALAKLIRVAAVNHIIIPGLMFAVSKAFRDGWDDWDWRDTVDLGSAMLLGSFEGVYVAGRLIQGMITSLMTGDAERSPEAIPAMGDLYNAARIYYRTGGKIIEGEQLTAKDFLDFVQGTGTILEPLGITWQPLGDAGMVLDAIGTQGKRMNKLLENDERKKKKRRK